MNAPRLSDLAAHWLAIALGDLATAEAVLGDSLLPPREAAAFAEQAAEKAIKGALVFTGREPPRTHDLSELASLAPAGWRVRSLDLDLAPLAGALRPARYPEYFDAPVTRDEAARLVSDARAVVAAVLADLREHGLEPPPAA
jgi:HEPN domain-containing protein